MNKIPWRMVGQHTLVTVIDTWSAYRVPKGYTLVIEYMSVNNDTDTSRRTHFYIDYNDAQLHIATLYSTQIQEFDELRCHIVLQEDETLWIRQNNGTVGAILSFDCGGWLYETSQVVDVAVPS